MTKLSTSCPSTASGARRAVLGIAVALAVGLGALAVQFGDSPTSLSGTGGDTVGSLPLMSGPGAGDLVDAGSTAAIAGPDRPAFSLCGREDDVLAVILDAYPTGPDGSFERVTLPNGRVRYQFYGRMTVLLDRQRMLQGTVRGQAMVGYSFVGGVAQVSVAGIPRSSEALTYGPKELQLQALDTSGLLAQGLSWHAVSLQNRHRVIHMKTVGNVLRVDQRD